MDLGRVGKNSGSVFICCWETDDNAERRDCFEGLMVLRFVVRFRIRCFVFCASFGTHLWGSLSLIEELGNKGSAGLSPWVVPMGDVVKSPRSASSGAMNEVYPGCEQEISLLASVSGGETGAVW